MTKTRVKRTQEIDVLAKAVQKAGQSTDDLRAVRVWLAEQLLAQEYAKLGQGGHTNTQVPLRQVFIDLPIAAEPSASFLHEDRALFLKCLLSAEPLNLQTVFRSGADIGSSSHANKEECDEDIELYGAALDDIPLKTHWGATLLIGGPGQGKSTLGQLACQLNRATLVRPASADLTSAQRDIVNSFIPASQLQEDSIEESPIELLNNPLLPLQITLPEFAEWAARSGTANAKENIPSSQS